MGIGQAGDNISGTTEESTIEECATLERAARLLSHVRSLQADLRRSHEALVAAAKAAGGLTAADLSHSLGHQHGHVDALLSNRTRQLENKLVSRLEVTYGSEIVPDILAGGDYRSSVNVNTLALSYCLRAYSCLGAQTRSNDYSDSNFAENADSSARGAVGRAYLRVWSWNLILKNFSH